MAAAPNDRAHQALTRHPLVLAPRGWRHGRLAAGVLLALAMGIGATLAWPHAWPSGEAAPEPPELVHWRELAQERELALRLAESRAGALKQQIDTLNRELRQAREELTFLRQARDGKR